MTLAYSRWWWLKLYGISGIFSSFVRGPQKHALGRMLSSYVYSVGTFELAILSRARPTRRRPRRKTATRLGEIEEVKAMAWEKESSGRDKGSHFYGGKQHNTKNCGPPLVLLA